MKREKTYKRELAVILLSFWGYLVLNVDHETIAVVTPWIFLYTLGAFGIDAYSKQVKLEANGVKLEGEG